MYLLSMLLDSLEKLSMFSWIHDLVRGLYVMAGQYMCKYTTVSNALMTKRQSASLWPQKG